MEDSDVVEIPPPVNWPSKPKSLKRRKVICPDIIDVDDYEDFSVSGKTDPKGKQVFVDLSDNSSAETRNYASGNDLKATGESSKGSKFSKRTFNEDDLIYVDDDLMEYALSQSLLDAPTGIDVSMPWATYANGNNMNSASASTQSASRPRADPNKGFTSSKAYGLRAHSDFGKKSLPPHGNVVHSVHNQTSTAANKFPKSLAPLEQVIHSLPKHYTTAANSFPKASMFTRKRRFNNLDPSMYTGMNSNVGVNHMFPYATGWNHSSPNFMGIQTDSASTGIVSGSPGPSFKIVNENPDVMLKKLDLFKKFDTADDFSDHIFCNSNAFAMNQPPRSWSKKIQDEWRILENGLPDTIFVRVYESRMDLLRAAIIGAEGTPYHDGLFFFDVFFPSDYPNVPPQVMYHSGGLRINPNLYHCGKVCLSLLNTWTGDKRQMWIPAKSTMLQVLVSIQGLILNEEPVYNEPSFEKLRGKAAGDKHSLDYNEKTLIHSLKTMVYSIRRPPKHFEDLVVGHFFKRAHNILAACRAYKNGAQVGSVVVKGGVESVSNKGRRGNSQTFKNDLAVCLKTLVEAFGQVGVKDCDRFLH